MIENAMDVKTFTIRPKEEGNAKSVTGLVDNRLFKGGNKLNAIQDAGTCLWSLKYEIGGLPEGLKDLQFTRIKAVEDHVKRYFDKRGLVATLEEKHGTSSSQA
jgi:hypothetical protein